MCDLFACALADPYCLQYAHEVRLCDDILRKIRFLKETAVRAGLVVEPTGDVVNGLGETPINLSEMVTREPFFL